jgi:hypothetical protein
MNKPIIPMSTQEWQNKKLGRNPQRDYRWLMVAFAVARKRMIDFFMKLKDIIGKISSAVLDVFRQLGVIR